MAPVTETPSAPPRPQPAETDRLAPTLVVNWNSPELNALALGLARAGELAGFVRPYVRQDRQWERLLAATPGLGALHARTFGRRRLPGPELAPWVVEAGLGPDLLAAALGRWPGLDPARRQRWQSALHRRVREAVAAAAGKAVDTAAGATVPDAAGAGPAGKEATTLAGPPGAAPGHAAHVVAYEGFALPAFRALRQRSAGLAVLNYPVAHHRHRRAARLAEIAREPDFAATWPDFDDWPPGHEAALDEEIASADIVLLGSAWARETFVTAGVPAHKLCVVPYGVDLATFHPGPARALRQPGQRPFEVLFAGQLSQRKGLSHLLAGFEAFDAADATLTLVGSVVGSAAPLARCGRRVRHVPHLTRPALAARLRSADVFVFPTLVEGMPLVVLEAMACGLPVIATAHGPAEVVRDGIDGFIVPTHDPAAIADRLRQLHADPVLAAAMGASAAERARSFGWDRYAAGVRAALLRAQGGMGR
jgi:glycosyltransferase involved in cell wall biosynthesis